MTTLNPSFSPISHDPLTPEKPLKILNLGCGMKTSARPEVTNIDWTIYLRMKRNPFLQFFVPLLLKGERLDRFNALPDNILVHNLAKGLPFDSNSIDVVYHSHLLEHLDQDIASQFLSEIKRVLKPGGIQRIVVPDFEAFCRDYLNHVSAVETNPTEASQHDFYISEIIEQSVRKAAFATRQQSSLRSFVETALLGDARKRGETHQWMYDRINLSNLLVSLGYNNPIVQAYNTSLIPNWNEYGLDLDRNGNEYKPKSLYIEAQK